MTPGNLGDVTSALQVYSPASSLWKGVITKGRVVGVEEVIYIVWRWPKLPSGRIHVIVAVASIAGVVTTQSIVKSAPTTGADGELVNMRLAGWTACGDQQ